MKRYLLISPLIILLVIVLVGFAALFLQKSSNANLIEKKLQKGEQVDLPKFSLITLDDSQINFSNDDLLGKYSIVNFFASWCSSCGAENPLLLELAKNDKIKIFGVAWRDIDQSTKNYLSKNGNPYSKVGIDSQGIFAKSLGVVAMPESFVINPQGKVIYYQKGAIDDGFVGFVSLIHNSERGL